MHELSQKLEPHGSITSLSLQDLVNARPPFLGRIGQIARTGLMIWGAISLSAAAGYAALQLQGGPEEPVLRSERLAVERPVVAAKPARALAAPRTAEAAAPTAPAVADMARLPRPRPDEPIITGSIARMADDPYAHRAARYDDPCEAWNSLGMPFRLRCVRESRAGPRYYPAYRDGW